MKSPDSYVVDTSVAARWVLPAQYEPYTDEAMKLLERYAAGKVALSVPDLFWPEIANVLWKSARLGRISRGGASEAMEWLLDLHLTTRPAEPLTAEALAVAASLDRTVYDSLYLVLALDMGRTFITADERFAGAVALHAPVQWLGSFE